MMKRKHGEQSDVCGDGGDAGIGRCRGRKRHEIPPNKVEERQQKDCRARPGHKRHTSIIETWPTHPGWQLRVSAWFPRSASDATYFGTTSRAAEAAPEPCTSSTSRTAPAASRRRCRTKASKVPAAT